MKQLIQPDYHEVLKIIPSNVPNRTVVESVICGYASGDIWVDQIKNTSCVFINTGILFSFIFGVPDEMFLREICNEITKKASRYLYVDYAPLVDFFENLYEKVNMVQLLLPSIDMVNIKMDRFDSFCPYSIKPITDFNFKKSNWYELMKKIFNGEKNYLKYAKGYCIYDGEKIISEAHTGYVSDSSFEIATITLPEYQGQNLSYSVCHSLLTNYANQNHYKPVWSCKRENHASIAVAKKLGFHKDEYYTLIEL